MFCGMCGAENPGHSLYCNKCGAALDAFEEDQLKRKTVVDLKQDELKAKEMELQAEKKRLDEEKEKIKREERKKKENDQWVIERIKTNTKSVGLAVFINLFLPGIGQMYFGKYYRGIAYLLVSLGCTLVELTNPSIMVQVMIFDVCVMGISMIDVYIVGSDYNDYVLHHEGNKPW